MKQLFALLLPAALLVTCALGAQSPGDAILMNARQACILLEYNYASFDHYWEGETRRDNQTIAMVKRNTFMPMVAVGIFDNLNLYAGVPYVTTESTTPNGGKFAGASGIQDLTVAVKYRWLNKTREKGQLAGLATLGFSTPVSNYLPDYQPYSIGLGATQLAYRAIVEYKYNTGWYLRGAGTYLWRGYAEAEREYYYNGGSYYTSLMDVPNAITAEGVVGKWLWSNALQVEASYFGSASLSGDDIRAYSAPQPTNQVNIGRVGIFAHYFSPKFTGLGILAYYNRVIQGRNAAEMNTTGVGLTYFFNYRK